MSHLVLTRLSSELWLHWTLLSPEGLDALAKVLLNDCAELVDAPLVDQVLQARLLAVIAAPVVTLSRHDGLQRVEYVVLVHKAQAVRQACESGGLPACGMSSLQCVLGFSMCYGLASILTDGIFSAILPGSKDILHS